VTLPAGVHVRDASYVHTSFQSRITVLVDAAPSSSVAKDYNTVQNTTLLIVKQFITPKCH